MPLVLAPSVAVRAKGRNIVTKKISNAFRYALALWLTLLMLCAFGATFIAYVGTERQVQRAERVRHQSVLLSD